MSGFSAELIDYLEGRITFEEFDKRRDERRVKVGHKVSAEGVEDDAQPSTSAQFPSNKDDGVSPGVQLAFASMLGETPQPPSSEEEEEEEEDKVEGAKEDPSVGDVFALEMELNRENKKMMRERRHRSKLPRALRGLMGEANIRYARGEKEDAIMMCMEIIRQGRNRLRAHEPGAGQHPYNPTNVRYLWERSSLHMRLGEHKHCMDGYRRILSLLPMEDGEHFMQLSKDMAKSYYESSDLTSALGVIEDALLRHPSLVSDDFINMAAELYIASRQYNKALEVQLCAESTAEEEEKKTEIKDVQVPDSVPVDLRAKLMVCLIHLHVFTPLEGLVSTLMEQSAEEIGDLYLDVAEAYLEEGEYMTALPLLSALVISEKYNLAVVWLRHAECLKALGHMEVAAESYTKVVEMAPLHLEARLSLATLQQQLGRPECALKALESMYDSETLAQDSSAAQKELKLLLHRSTLLKTQGRIQDYLDSTITMISMLLKVAMQRAKVVVRSVIVSGENHLRLVKVKDMQTEIADQEAAYLDNTGKTNVLSKEDWWQLLVSCVLTLCDVQRYEEAELMVESAMEFYSFYDNKPRRKEMEFIGLSATILDRNHYNAYNYIRLMLMEKVDLPQLWNIFNQLTITSHHQRHHRFCLRLLLKHPENHALCVLCGHNAMVSGSFKHALGQYVQAFQTHPDNPLYSLCVGLTFFHMASQKYVAKRHALVLQGFSFLWRYVELRGECQESMYNLGRALHQMGLTHLAIHYYQKALTMPAPKLEGMPDDQVDLQREIAFNLSLIYQASGNMGMARQLINTHCVV
uniref:General transcription factor IIIC, polypeptide 3 n=1 Tax=Sparus aurata TaxID=8175 RepID=A0A671Z3H2_SPAAU